MAVAGLVLGIIGLVLSLIPCTFWLGGVVSIIGVIFGAVGMSSASKAEPGSAVAKGKGMATAGLVCGVIGTVVAIGWFVVGMQANDEVEGELEKMRKELRENPPKFEGGGGGSGGGGGGSVGSDD